ncbi:MAG: D-alanyl-D-alanine carboxypeptidase [Coxiellaceae bacterium]|nr:D-alanyl-D-alanine carboxypeptidase [Coxiellaceae bacterium]
MKSITLKLISTLAASSLCAFSLAAKAPATTPLVNSLPNKSQTHAVVSSPVAVAPTITPPAPNINAKGFVLMDAQSGNIIAQKNMNERMQPASLTKMMTLYIVSQALQSGRIHLDDKVRISERAWRTGGSRMFVKAGSLVPVGDLIKGVIVDSGNDACTALAEFVAGNEEMFAQLMNQAAQQLGMKDTHYVDSTGLPRPQHYSTPHDMAILARALVTHFPEYYGWYKQKWLTYNNIKQPNRNRLLWRDASFDGIKTGHTKEAGYCLVSSGIRNGTRLLSVVMGAPTEPARINDSQALLNYGFRFFETHKLFSANQPVANPRVWLGKNKTTPMGLKHDLYVTIPTGSYKKLKADMTLQPKLTAPVMAGQSYGEVEITLNGKKLSTMPLVALQADPRGGVWTRMTDHIAQFFHNWFKA